MTHSDDWLVGVFNHDSSLSNEIGHHYAITDPACSEAHINERETWAVVSAARGWKGYWHDRCGMFITDNTTVHAALATVKTN